MAFPFTLESKAIAICQKLSQNNQISLLVKHKDRVFLWLEEAINFLDLADWLID